MSQKKTDDKPRIRCAIYTRKSTEDGLELDFNSLDAQRDSGEAYIKSQQQEGWICLDRRYDDGGYTGGNMDRPALRRLLADIEAGEVDCVVVYKVDRLSRSLLDFSRMMETFDASNVSFVSVTQQFNTTHSMGRLTLNILLSFAQFEREIISERTRDKIAAARRKGKWAGGRPILGYDMATDSGGAKIKPNRKEAQCVRQIFELYVGTPSGSLTSTIKELDERGWRNKRWTTKKGKTIGGKRFDKSALRRLLTNVAYVGKVAHGQNIYDGEHEAIVPQDLFDKAQATLERNRHHNLHSRNRQDALLRGLVRCGHCGTLMTPHYSCKKRPGKAAIRYRYYVCSNAQKRGWAVCPHASVPASALEQFVVERIREVAQNSSSFRDVLFAAQEQITDAINELKEKRDDVRRKTKRLAKEIGRLASESNADAQRMLQKQEDMQQAQRQITELDAGLCELEEKLVNESAIMDSLKAFDPVWQALSPGEREKVAGLLIEQVVYDGENESVSVTFRTEALKTDGEPMGAAA